MHKEKTCGDKCSRIYAAGRTEDYQQANIKHLRFMGPESRALRDASKSLGRDSWPPQLGANRCMQFKIGIL